jgi:uncharacterized RDD family membrane protein YckC
VPYCPSCGGFHADDAVYCPFCGGPVGDTPRPVRYAGFWRRLGGTLIDGLVVAVPMGAILNTLGVYGVTTTQSRDAATGRQVVHLHFHAPAFGLVMAAGFVIHGIYSVLMQSSRTEGTVGQIAAGMRVTDLEGNRITRGRSTVRYLVFLLSYVTLGVTNLVMLWTPRRQALHDLAADTIVVLRRP